MTFDNVCLKHKIPLKCLAGHSAHPNNWYCPKCCQEEHLKEHRQYLKRMEDNANE